MSVQKVKENGIGHASRALPSLHRLSADAHRDLRGVSEWDGFCEMSEEAQNELLAKTNPDTRKGRRTRKLDKSTRDLLRRHGDKQFSQVRGRAARLLLHPALAGSVGKICRPCRACE